MDHKIKSSTVTTPIQYQDFQKVTLRRDSTTRPAAPIEQVTRRELQAEATVLDQADLTPMEQLFAQTHEVYHDRFERVMMYPSPCAERYVRKKHGGPPSRSAQKAIRQRAREVDVIEENGSTTRIRALNCWSCKKLIDIDEPRALHADHQPPLIISYYEGGCCSGAMKNAVQTSNTEPGKEQYAILPHCRKCSNRQGQSQKKIAAYLHGLSTARRAG